MVKERIGPGRGWRRHVPPLALPARAGGDDRSRSRGRRRSSRCPRSTRRSSSRWTCRAACAPTDVEPNRLAAAQEAAKAFVAEQPRTTRIGVVSFAGTAALVQPPTHNREDIVAAIDRFQLQRGTAIGSGILVSLAALFPGRRASTCSQSVRQASKSRPLRRWPTQCQAARRPSRSSRCRRARTTSAAIILLTDGQRTTGPDPIEAAQMAADRGVRVFTVGIGTPRRRDHRLRRLVDARAARRGDAEEHRRPSPAASTSTPATRPT